MRQSQGTQEKGVAAKVTLPLHQGVCSALITKLVNPGIIKLENTWGYTETIE